MGVGRLERMMGWEFEVTAHHRPGPARPDTRKYRCSLWHAHRSTPHALASRRHRHGGDLAADQVAFPHPFSSAQRISSRPHRRTAAPPARCRRTKPPEERLQRETSPDAKADRNDGREKMRGWFTLDDIGMDILTIALPAVLALAADPITALIDTAFVGHVGSAELAAVGASISIFNLVSKLLNVPLLNVTTSFVAEQQAVDANYNSSIQRFTDAYTSRTISYFKGIWCTTSHSSTCSTGYFSWIHGYKDTVVCCGYLTAFILLWKLNSRIVLFSWNVLAGDIIRYLKSGALLIARTIAVVLTFTVSTSLAAREGPVPMAGYEICLQVWLTISLLNDALALAGQALLANEYAKGNYKKARVVLYRVLQVGGVTGVTLATALFLGFGYLSMLFTDDPAVLDVARTGVWFVTISQPINAVAFVADGLYYGVSDFSFAAYSTVQSSSLILSHSHRIATCYSCNTQAILIYLLFQLLAGAVSSAVMLVVAPKFGLAGVWAGLTLFMSLRAIAGFWRVGSKGGPWKIIWSETE